MAIKKVNQETNIFALAGLEEGFDPFSWYNLPECEQNDAEAPYVMTITFKSKEDLHHFADVINQPLLKEDTKLKTKSIWHPKLVNGERGSNKNYIWMDEDSIQFKDNNE